MAFQCGARIKKLRGEDTRMLKILSKRQARWNWNYGHYIEQMKHIAWFLLLTGAEVFVYTCCPSNLDPTDTSGKKPEGLIIYSLLSFT